VASNGVASEQRETDLAGSRRPGRGGVVLDEPEARGLTGTGRDPDQEAGLVPPARAPWPADRGHGAQAQRPRLGAAGGIGLALLVPSLAVMLAVLVMQLRSLTQALLLAIPVALLGAGLERIGKALRVAPLRATGALVAVLAVGGALVLATMPTEPLDRSRAGSPVPSGASSARMQASMGGGALRVRPGGSGLFEADLRSVGRSTAQVSRSAELAVVDIDAPQEHGLLARNRGSEWDVALSTALPWRLRLDAGAVTADLDVQQLNVAGVEVDAGPSRLALRLGQPGGRTPVTLNLDAGMLDLYLPRDASLELEVSGKVLRDFGDRQLERSGSGWRAGPLTGPAYVVKVHLGAGRVRLHWR
jgi:hypothetical protein